MEHNCMIDTEKKSVPILCRIFKIFGVPSASGIMAGCGIGKYPRFDGKCQNCQYYMGMSFNNAKKRQGAHMD